MDLEKVNGKGKRVSTEVADDIFEEVKKSSRPSERKSEQRWYYPGDLVRKKKANDVMIKSHSQRMHKKGYNEELDSNANDWYDKEKRGLLYHKMTKEQKNMP